jgi:hypothetical protein
VPSTLTTLANFAMIPQPDDETCGPTCLHAVYRFHGDDLALGRVIDEVERLDDGGTLAVLLACHALEHGYAATIYSYNLQVFDPTWFEASPSRIVDRLRLQIAAKPDPKIQAASAAYVRFLQRGGELRFEDLTPELIRAPLRQGLPVVTGLSATYLYRTPREHGRHARPDDVHGVPSGHFVVLCGFDEERRTVRVADPYEAQPLADSHLYDVDVDRLVCAILLGIVTHDANLLVIERRR